MRVEQVRSYQKVIQFLLAVRKVLFQIPLLEWVSCQILLVPEQPGCLKVNPDMGAQIGEVKAVHISKTGFQVQKKTKHV